jgi:hypothetical protein
MPSCEDTCQGLSLLSASINTNDTASRAALPIKAVYGTDAGSSPATGYFGTGLAHLPQTPTRCPSWGLRISLPHPQNSGEIFDFDITDRFSTADQLDASFALMFSHEPNTLAANLVEPRHGFSSVRSASIPA